MKTYVQKTTYGVKCPHGHRTNTGGQSPPLLYLLGATIYIFYNWRKSGTPVPLYFFCPVHLEPPHHLAHTLGGNRLNCPWPTGTHVLKVKFGAVDIRYKKVGQSSPSTAPAPSAASKHSKPRSKSKPKVVVAPSRTPRSHQGLLSNWLLGGRTPTRLVLANNPDPPPDRPGANDDPPPLLKDHRSPDRREDPPPSIVT